jgi:hypothetical protein
MKRQLPLLLAIAILASCGEGTAPGGALKNVAVSFATQSAPGTAPQARIERAGSAAGTSATLILESVQVVLREIELKRTEITDCDLAVESDACEKFETGPALVPLPLDGSVTTQVAIDIPAGSYDEIEFEIHKVSSDGPDDAAFRQAHPDFVDISIRVTGTFDAQAFVFETDLDVEQELDLAPPLVIGEDGGSTNVTILVDVGSWFRDQSGALVNPASGNKGGENESVIKENIKVSIEAFEDEDKDGNR